MRVEAYAWNETDSEKDILIEDFDTPQEAMNWLDAQNKTNKFLAVTAGQVKRIRDLLWNGKGE